MIESDKLHEDFENTLAAQEKMVAEFDHLTTSMINKNLSESEG